MESHPLQRLSYALPIGAVALATAALDLEWWATSALVGLFLLAWDWLWGDPMLLQKGMAVTWVGLGLLGLAASYYLAFRLGMDWDGFVATRSQASTRADWLYLLPVTSLGLVVYGLGLFFFLLGGSRGRVPR